MVIVEVTEACLVADTLLLELYQFVILFKAALELTCTVVETEVEFIKLEHGASNGDGFDGLSQPQIQELEEREVIVTPCANVQVDVECVQV